MKRRVVILSALLAAVALAWAVSHRLFTHRLQDDPAPPPPGDPLAWMQTELHVDDATLTKVRALHESYQPTCAEMCLGIARANGRVRSLMETNRRMTTELADAIREAQLRQADCRTAMLRHIYETAALLPADAAQRYLSIVTTRLVEEGMCLADVTENKP